MRPNYPTPVSWKIINEERRRREDELSQKSQLPLHAPRPVAPEWTSDPKADDQPERGVVQVPDYIVF